MTNISRGSGFLSDTCISLMYHKWAQEPRQFVSSLGDCAMVRAPSGARVSRPGSARRRHRGRGPRLGGSRRSGNATRFSVRGLRWLQGIVQLPPRPDGLGAAGLSAGFAPGAGILRPGTNLLSYRVPPMLPNPRQRTAARWVGSERLPGCFVRLRPICQ